MSPKIVLKMTPCTNFSKNVLGVGSFHHKWMFANNLAVVCNSMCNPFLSVLEKDLTEFFNFEGPLRCEL